jgi:hypothetical protein
MENFVSNVKSQLVIINNTENQKGIENHKNAAIYLNAAAKNHLEAAKHHEDGNHHKAAQSTVSAYGNNSLAHKVQKEDFRHHMVNG